MTSPQSPKPSALPAIELDGKRWWPILLSDETGWDGGPGDPIFGTISAVGGGKEDEWRRQTIAHLAQLLEALDEKARAEVLAPFMTPIPGFDLGAGFKPFFTLEPITAADHDKLGKWVRDAWVTWAREQASPKPHWLIPWEELDEFNREADRRIGVAVAGRARWDYVKVYATPADLPAETKALRERIKEAESRASRAEAQLRSVLKLVEKFGRKMLPSMQPGDRAEIEEALARIAEMEKR